MTKRRGMYKEYIQILPSADAETAPPLVTCSETISGLALPPPGGHAGDSRECEPAAAPPSAPDLPPELLLDPVAAPMARARVPSDGRIALIAATLALALSTGALTWMLSRTALSQPTDAVAALSAEIAGLKGRLAAADEQARVGNARIQELAERLDRAGHAQTEAAASLARFAAQLTSFEADLDARVKAATEAAIAATLPSPADITASIASLPGAEPPREPARPAPPKPNVAAGWVLRDISHGVALVENRRGVFEAAVGTPLPGLGRVEAIERRNGRTVVVTSKGLILPPARE